LTAKGPPDEGMDMLAPSGSGGLDAEQLAERVTQRMADLVRRVEVASDDLVTAEGIPN